MVRTWLGGPGVVACGFGVGPHRVRFFPVFVASLVLAAVTQVCEIAIAKMLEVMLDPVAVPREGRYEFWLALCGCFSSYFLLSCTIIPLSIATATWFWPRHDRLAADRGRVGGGALRRHAAVVVAGVVRAVAARSDRSARQIVAILLVP